MDKRKILILSIVITTMLLSSFTFYFYQVIYSPNFLVEKEDRYMYISSGATFEDVQKMIYEDKYVNEPIAFGMLAKFMKYNELVKPGKYLIRKNSNNFDVIRKLRAGDQEPVRITFNNSRLLEDVASKLTVNIELEADELLDYLSSESVAKQYGFDIETFRTMFIPNTYEVYWTYSKEQLVRKLNQEYQRFWNDARKAKANQMGLSEDEVSILASIVQAEISYNDESPIVAGLYLNRLERHMALQADPTLIYAVGDFTIKRVLNIHKEIDSPYNTYKNVGLPPGPINFPSIISIDAVLNAQSHNYIYMCAKEDFSGYHNFASNLREHNVYARKYQNALNKARLYR